MTNLNTVSQQDRINIIIKGVSLTLALGIPNIFISSDRSFQAALCMNCANCIICELPFNASLSWRGCIDNKSQFNEKSKMKIGIKFIKKKQVIDNRC